MGGYIKVYNQLKVSGKVFHLRALTSRLAIAGDWLEKPEHDVTKVKGISPGRLSKQ